MKMIKFLGVWMTPDVGETVSFVINLDKDGQILVDCGTNLVGSLVKNKIDPSEITHIIVTHSHGDHISGLPTFLFYRLLIAPGILGRKAEKLHIIGQKDTLLAVKEYIRIAYGAIADNPLLQYDEVGVSDYYSFGSAKFEFFPAQHKPETIGFCAKIEEKKLVYSADTGISENIVAIAENADYLIHDVVGTSKYKMLSGTHTLCNEISPLLSKYGVKNFYPVHRLPIYNNNLDDYVDELQACYSGNVIIPNDGDSIILSE